MKMKLIILVSVLVSVVCGNDVIVERDQLQQQEQIKEAAAVFQNVIESMLEDFVSLGIKDIDPINLPYFPLLNTETISLSMSEFEFGGFANIDPSIKGALSATPTLIVTWPAIRLNADGYVAGGHIERVPFVGRSSMKTTIVEMKAAMTYEHEFSLSSPYNYCVIPNTTHFEVTMDHLNVRFEDLNPGQDTGEVVNSMISSIGPDIVDVVSNVLNGPLAETMDNIVITLINNVINAAIAQDLISTDRFMKCDDEGDVEKILQDLPDVFEEMFDSFEGLSGAIGQLRKLVDFKDVIEKLVHKF